MQQRHVSLSLHKDVYPVKVVPIENLECSNNKLLSTLDEEVYAVKEELYPWDVAQLVRASDRHAADAGSIPRCGKGFFSLSQLSVQTLFRYPYIPVCNRLR